MRNWMMAGLVIAAIASVSWMACRRGPAPTSTPTSPAYTLESSEEVARSFVQQEPTYLFDGISNSLELVGTETLRCPWCWEFTYRFLSAHSGYGDRTGQNLLQAITPHQARVTVQEHSVTRAVMDGRWDMQAQTFLPEMDPEKVFKGGVVATFRVLEYSFRVFMTNPDTIEELFRLQRGESGATIPSGALREGPGIGNHNAPWSWHLDPEDTHMAEITIELCDGTPQFVEDELDYWLNTVKRYCPWSAELVDIRDYR